MKRVEAEEKKKKEEERKKRKAEEEQRKKDEAKAALAATEAKKRAETEKAGTGKRKDRDDSGMGTRLYEDGLTWFSQEGVVCEHCEKSRVRCLWMNTPQAKACRACVMNMDLALPKCAKTWTHKLHHHM